MRLWSVHPSYLDSKGLVAVWREGLLARAVLRGATRGYRRHPQLVRFRNSPAPISAINSYLRTIAEEADRRGYRFDKSKIGPVRRHVRIPVMRAQLAFELTHLCAKIQARAPAELRRLPESGVIRAHPLFEIRSGTIETWEKGVSS
jgi:hypothetical protein